MNLKQVGIAVGIVLSIVVYGFIFYHGCVKSQPNIGAITLRPNETDKITITPSTIIVANRKPDGTTGIVVNRNYHHGVTVTRRTDGTVEARPKDLGLNTDFGLSTDFQSIGVGTEFLYYKDLSLLGGSHFINLKTTKLQLNLYVAVGYRLPYTKLNNVSVFAGFDTDRKVIGGVFIRFGNS